ncbi:MAG TPA: aminotransferase class III-fold pyridoxal phosphate-dependent enzyme [Xanthobacteraceae bacterium]|nr:aminotransferase class III-fold pyridoxal phosphate-dependent enzyme [Xanthobacteraceae bacterium]
MPNRKSSDAERGLVETARRVLPGGGFGNVPHEIVIAGGRGGRVWDVSGNEYVDYLLGSGPMLIGHAHPEVVAAVEEQLAKGTTFFANNEHGIRLAAEIVDAVPCAEKVRFVSSGSEADLYAMRAARAYMKRDKILKFEGGYHGMSDYGLMSLAPRQSTNFPRPIPDSAGIPRSIRDEVLVAPFNDLETVASLVREHRQELAAIIVEPMQRLIPPKPGFLEGLRKLTADNGMLLIFDEVVTGFRLAYGGAQEYYGVVPDICTLGKTIGGGFPLAAIAGRADVMAHFDKGAVGEDAFMMQVGTLSGNPIAAVAGLKTLEILKRAESYDRIFANGRALIDGYERILQDAGVKARVVGEPALFDIVFTYRDVIDYRSAMGDQDAMKRCNGLLREGGILKGESKYYVSLAHTDEDIRFTLDAFASAIAEIARMRAA